MLIDTYCSVHTFLPSATYMPEIGKVAMAEDFTVKFETYKKAPRPASQAKARVQYLQIFYFSKESLAPFAIDIAYTPFRALHRE